MYKKYRLAQSPKYPSGEEDHGRQPQYFLPLYSIRTRAIWLTKSRLREYAWGRGDLLPMKSHVTIKSYSITITLLWDFLTSNKNQRTFWMVKQTWECLDISHWLVFRSGFLSETLKLPKNVCGAQRRPLLMYIFFNEVKFNLMKRIMLFTWVFVE